MASLKLIIHNVRSCYNVGALLRSADGFGVDEVICTGYSPYPKQANDPRLPHVAQRAHRQIAKTALGAEQSVVNTHGELPAVISDLKSKKYTIYALEQSAGSQDINQLHADFPLALVVGPEREGLDQATLKLCDEIIEIPMRGQKESLNVSVAGSLALFVLANQRFQDSNK